MIFAYADPPYVGQSRKWYKDHPDYAGEVDHSELISRLVRDYPDGWALSLSATSLKQILVVCPDDVRVLAWVKPFTPFRKGVRVAYAWEPVIIRGGRQRSSGQCTVRDWVSVSINNFHSGERFAGRKPDAFCFWLFEVLGMQADDDLHDLFPGSGAVTRAWWRWQAQTSIPPTPIARQPALLEAD